MDVKFFRLYKCVINVLQALAIMDIAHGKEHPYILEVKKEIEDQN